MHELTLAESIVNTVKKAIQDRQEAKVLLVRVKIGELSEIVPDSLQFGFESLILDTPLAGAKLEIEKVPIIGKCVNCSHEFTVEEFMFICPQCFSSDINMIQGDELEISNIEVE
jgi:hydrogenase nickel incorporation protein HypA/HybF